MIGIAAASRYGLATEGDVMVNGERWRCSRALLRIGAGAREAAVEAGVLSARLGGGWQERQRARAPMHVGHCAGASQLLSPSLLSPAADWLPGRWEGVLSALMTLYLGVAVAPMAIAFRAQLEK